MGWGVYPDSDKCYHKTPAPFPTRGLLERNPTCNIFCYAAGATIRSSIGLLAAVKPYISV